MVPYNGDSIKYLDARGDRRDVQSKRIAILNGQYQCPSGVQWASYSLWVRVELAVNTLAVRRTKTLQDREFEMAVVVEGRSSCIKKTPCSLLGVTKQLTRIPISSYRIELSCVVPIIVSKSLPYWDCSRAEVSGDLNPKICVTLTEDQTANVKIVA